ncbi:MAG: sulfatase-like hydrolase/transferase, partial [Boseongicola sp.]|nr:sulfatase-like hydrolase/transferase [Boseongicola sp.]
MSLTRRKFLQSSTAVTAAALSGGCQTLGTAATDEPVAGRRWELARKPNILLAVLDDVGFGDLGCYGSDVPTACMDGLAANGVRYNNFHVSSLCAPTRASLLTGMNAHAAGVGNIAEWGRDHPGYRGWIRNDVRTLPEILGPSGYRCYAAGKWHLSTVAGRNATGPFDQWPTGRGFDHWYGFLGAAADHWHPELFRNRTATYPDKTGGYHLTEDLVDRSMAFVKDHLVAAAAEPFFLYLAFGACHFPYHVPPEFMARHLGRYDAGWDEIRAQRFARQQALGIVPENAQLAPRDENVPAWQNL